LIVLTDFLYKCHVLHIVKSTYLDYVLNIKLSSSDSQCGGRGFELLLRPRCFLEQETLPLLLSTGWFLGRIRAWFHNRTKFNWGPYGRL